jgi:Reverse transcriptase (RNA-dependent DNA polymerase)
MKSPNDKKIIGYKWVFKRKIDGSNSEAFQYKASLVTKDYSQVQGVDFNDVFLPVVKHISIQILLSLVVIKVLELEQLDVKIVFLYSDMKEQIYIKQMEDFEIIRNEDHVCLLKKSLSQRDS